MELLAKRVMPLGGEVVVEATQRNERRPGWGIRLAAASAVVTLALSTAGAYALDRTQNGSSTSGSASNESASSSSVLVNNTSPWENQESDNAQLRIVATDGNGPYESTWGVEEAGGFSYGDGPYLLDGGSVPYSIPSGVYPMAGVETKPDLDNPNDFGVEFTSRPITAEVVAKAGELATVVFDFANGSAKTIYTPEQPIPQSQGSPW